MYAAFTWCILQDRNSISVLIHLTNPVVTSQVHDVNKDYERKSMQAIFSQLHAHFACLSVAPAVEHCIHEGIWLSQPFDFDLDILIYYANLYTIYLHTRTPQGLHKAFGLAKTFQSFDHLTSSGALHRFPCPVFNLRKQCHWQNSVLPGTLVVYMF